ncbi:MAG: HisA/HisF-related TIM barrel protein [Gemmatimonadota bacterium]
MIVYPAIDLLGGRCVRLARGSFEEVTVFADDPVAQARAFSADGAEALHFVYLDGARTGRLAHAAAIRRIRTAFDGMIQVGGGLRTDGDLAVLFEAGVDRAILGTAAALRPGWVATLVDRFGADRVAAAVDLRGRRVMVEGWMEQSSDKLEDLLPRLQDAGLRTIVFTDTERDGMLGSANCGRAAEFIGAEFETIVAGGVTGVADIRRLAAAGAAGAVVGSALYRARLTLPEAIEAARGIVDPAAETADVATEAADAAPQAADVAPEAADAERPRC